MSGGSIFKSLFQNATKESPGESPQVVLSGISPGQPSSSEQSMSETFPPITHPSGPEASTKSESDASMLADTRVSPSLEESLLAKMDSAVITFSEIMSDDSVLITEKQTGETIVRTEVPRYTFSERMKAAEFVRDWVVRRKKLTSNTAVDDDAPNITLLKEAIRHQVEETIAQKRVVTLPPKKAGRPTKEEAEQRRIAEEAVAEARLADEDDPVFTPLPSDGVDDELQRALRGK